MSIQPMSASIVAPPVKPVSKEDIDRMLKDKEKADAAKAKPREERTAQDIIAILNDFLNSFPGPQVCHANNLNVMA